MRAIGIIPARMGSTRFPGNPLASINGNPLLYHVWQATDISKLIEPFYIAMADKEIIDWCEFVGIKYLTTHHDCRSGTERVHDAMRQLKNLADDIVLNVQADEPMIRWESLDELARVFINPRIEIASLCFKSTEPDFASNPNRVKVSISDDGYAVEFARIVKVGWIWKQHVGVYAYRRDILRQLVELEPIGDLEQTAWMRAGHKIKMVEIPYETIAVDMPEDIVKVEKLIVAQNRP